MEGSKAMTEPAEPDGNKTECPPWCAGHHDPVAGDHLGVEEIGGVGTGGYIFVGVLQCTSSGSLVVERYVSVEARVDMGSRYNLRLSAGEAWQFAAILQLLGHESLALFVREAAQQITCRSKQEIAVCWRLVQPLDNPARRRRRPEGSFRNLGSGTARLALRYRPMALAVRR
jgi:hypothetical protein